jgi:hypothetical protein
VLRTLDHVSVMRRHQRFRRARLGTRAGVRASAAVLRGPILAPFRRRVVGGGPCIRSFSCRRASQSKLGRCRCDRRVVGLVAGRLHGRMRPGHRNRSTFTHIDPKT